MKILLTGATGFVGSAIARALLDKNVEVIAVVRQKPALISDKYDGFEWRQISSINDSTSWGNALEGVETVVHCAGRTHMMNEFSFDAFAAYRDINFLGTLHLAQKAAAAGVKRFIFLSSVKVNGESTEEGNLYTECCIPQPKDFYGQSKFEAEQALLSLAKKTQMEVVIIRPPLVYGPGVKGNFQVMLRWVQRGIPLPFGAINNKRSLLSLDNLVSFVLLCSDRKRSSKAANQIFLLADGEDVSTTLLLQKMAKAANCRSLLLPVPVNILRGGAFILGKKEIFERLLDNLQVDSSKARIQLGWSPLTSLDDQLVKIFSDAVDSN